MEGKRQVWKGVWETDDKPAMAPALRKYDKVGKIYPSSSEICHYWIRECDETNEVSPSLTKICHCQIVKVCWREKSEWKVLFIGQRMSGNYFRKASWRRWLVNEGWVGLSWREMKKPEQSMWSILEEKTESGKRGPGVRSIDEENHYSFSIPTHYTPSQRVSAALIPSRNTFFRKKKRLLFTMCFNMTDPNRPRWLSYSMAPRTLSKTTSEAQGSLRKYEFKTDIEDKD